MSDTRRLARRRAKLFAEHPYCCYCGRKLVLYEHEPNDILPGNFATTEHVNTRLGGPRPVSGETRLACLDCNKEKGAQDARAYWAAQKYSAHKLRHLSERIGDQFPELKNILAGDNGR